MDSAKGAGTGSKGVIIQLKTKVVSGKIKVKMVLGWSKTTKVWKVQAGEPKFFKPGSGLPRICVAPTHMRATHQRHLTWHFNIAPYPPRICVYYYAYARPILPNLPCYTQALHPPCICVASYTYAWLHPVPSTNIPTHMRHFQRICVATTMFPFPFHHEPTNFTIPPTYPCICVTSNAYAWLTHPPPHSTHFLSNTPTHMRTFLRICVPSYAYAWDSHPTLNLTAPSHFPTPCYPRIYVQPYVYAWNPRTNITPCSPHRACPRIDHLYA
ncbi:hypothetical protein PIB30_090770 [Stylosanthes scabra]|uniref:Uncharacterized protein n=1 Tax=Stylosanthes scabra TaxID=79078 RepID=A0ABU6YRY8_9FABA|nr:hypothetical protein [Stylosanthes scabra]